MKAKIFLASCAAIIALSVAGEAAAQDNHYLCRKVKDLGVPFKHAKQFYTAIDQVGADVCETKKPFLLCNPVSKNGGIIYDPTLHYVCYKTKCGQKPAVNFDITDQFNVLRLQTKKPFLLCNPASKAPA